MLVEQKLSDFSPYFATLSAEERIEFLKCDTNNKRKMKGFPMKRKGASKRRRNHERETYVLDEGFKYLNSANQIAEMINE